MLYVCVRDVMDVVLCLYCVPHVGVCVRIWKV